MAMSKVAKQKQGYGRHNSMQWMSQYISFSHTQYYAYSTECLYYIALR